MSNQANSCLPYPGGHIRYAFKMYVDHDASISCKVPHSKVETLVFEKARPADSFDPGWLMTITLGTVYSIAEVQKIGNMIKDDIFDMLSLILNTRISEIELDGFGLVPRPGEGAIAHLLMPFGKCNATGKAGGFKLNSEKIQDVQDAFLKMSKLQDKPSINLYRYAICSDEPVVQFLILYLILEEMYKNQSAVDKFIMENAPQTLQTNSPFVNSDGSPRLETVYTRLRNELVHKRENVYPTATRAEIQDHLDDFRNIVHSMILRTLLPMTNRTKHHKAGNVTYKPRPA
ncbi:MAG: hypothetical protein HQK55_10395 [Deltaproteobacteria bacterium]|nr:hypothetical protein [Deltaproteobacteria bacterium]